jgi:hypothetical protein
MSDTYTGSDVTVTSSAMLYDDASWSGLPQGESAPGPLDNVIVTGQSSLVFADVSGVGDFGGLDASQGATASVYMDAAGQLQIGTVSGSTVGGEFYAGAYGNVIAQDESVITAGPYVDAATGFVSVLSGAAYIWEGGGTAGSVSQVVNFYDPTLVRYAPGIFDDYSQFYGSVSDSAGGVINLMPGGPSAPAPTSASASIVGDAIDYQVAGSDGVVSHYSLALTTSAAFAQGWATFVPGADLSALHISDWTPGVGMTVTYEVPDDFNGDGVSDIALTQANGEEGVWHMSGTSVIGGGDTGAPPLGWTPVAVGDFYDFVGQQQVGDRYDNLPPEEQGVATWLLEDGKGEFGVMQYATVFTSQAATLVEIGSPGGTWALKGVGDFNGDGQSDLLLQDATGNVGIWELNGSAIIGGGIVANPGGTWQVAGVGDFNGDGKSDVLFQNASGEVAVWEMDGTSVIGGGDIGNPGGSWAVKGVGDFNNDGHADILFENASGEYAIWEMDGTQIVGGGDIGNPGGSWQFAAVGDYTGAGADILFQDASGNLAIWEMNGTQIVGGGVIGDAGVAWHVLG